MDRNRNATELNEALKGLWDSLTDEQKEKAKACKSMDELAALAGQMGVELPDEALDAVAGGGDHFRFAKGTACPYCGRRADPTNSGKTLEGIKAMHFYCARCNHTFFCDGEAYYDGNGNRITPRNSHC